MASGSGRIDRDDPEPVHGHGQREDSNAAISTGAPSSVAAEGRSGASSPLHHSAPPVGEQGGGGGRDHAEASSAAAEADGKGKNVSATLSTGSSSDEQGGSPRPGKTFLSKILNSSKNKTNSIGKICKKYICCIQHHHGPDAKGENILFQEVPLKSKFESTDAETFTKSVYSSDISEIKTATQANFSQKLTERILHSICRNDAYLSGKKLNQFNEQEQSLKERIKDHILDETDVLNKTRGPFLPALKNRSMVGDFLFYLGKMADQKSATENHTEENNYRINEKECGEATNEVDRKSGEALAETPPFEIKVEEPAIHLGTKAIFVDYTEGISLFNVDLDQPCVTLKNSIEEKLGYSLKEFSLSSGCQILEDHKKLFIYGLSEYCTIYLYPKLLGGSDKDKTLDLYNSSSEKLVDKLTIPHPEVENQTMNVQSLTPLGCRLAKSLVDTFVEAWRLQTSWSGQIQLKDFIVHRGRAESTKPATTKRIASAWLQDCKQLANMLKSIFQANGEEPLYFADLIETLENAKAFYMRSEWLKIYLQTHFAFIPSLNRASIVSHIMRMYDGMTAAGKKKFESQVNSVLCLEWTSGRVKSTHIFKETEDYRITHHGQGYDSDSFSCFKFLRNFNTHVTEQRNKNIAWDLAEYAIPVILGNFVPRVIKELLQQLQPIRHLLFGSVQY